ncbi:endo-1,4-beta-xylanase [Neobacillus pocheonensis]|uniref:Endo-1,4-beta-xylanase n=1 Tax=Neobacillus pocheonensis TaxID=363869 RepID=A0ABT0WCU4_9BACI|nr:endo-1,4-beta-xylanase [Neobacillus pocheonensis]
MKYSPVKGRKNWPLLFNEVGEPKKAFWTVIFSIEKPR